MKGYICDRCKATHPGESGDQRHDEDTYRRVAEARGVLAL